MENQNYQEYPVIMLMQQLLNQLKTMKSDKYQEDIEKLQGFLDSQQEPGLSRLSTIASPPSTARKMSTIYLQNKNTQSDLLRLLKAPLGCPDLKNTGNQKILIQYQQNMEQLNKKMGESIIMYNSQLSELQALNYMLNQHCSSLTNDAAGLQTEIVQVYQLTQNNRKTLQQRQEFHNKTIQMQNQFKHKKQKKMEDYKVQLLQLSEKFETELNKYRDQKHVVLDEIADIERKIQEEQAKLEEVINTSNQLFASLKKEMLSEIDRKLNTINALHSKSNDYQDQISKYSQKKMQYKVQMDQLSETFTDVKDQNTRSLNAEYEERLACFKKQLDDQMHQRLKELSKTLDKQWEIIRQLQRENEDLQDDINDKQHVDQRLKAQIAFYESEFLKYQEIRNKYQKEEKDILIGIQRVQKQLKNQTDEKSGIINKKLHYEVKNRSQNEQIKQLKILIEGKNKSIEELQIQKKALCQEKINQSVIATNLALQSKRDGLLKTLKDADNDLQQQSRAQSSVKGTVSPPDYTTLRTQSPITEIMDAPGILFKAGSPNKSLFDQKSQKTVRRGILSNASDLKRTQRMIKNTKDKQEKENLSPYMQFSPQKRRLNTR